MVLTLFLKPIKQKEFVDLSVLMFFTVSILSQILILKAFSVASLHIYT
jgi:hypothetical protein